MSEKVKSVNHGLPISVMKWWLVQGVTLPLSYDSWDRLQQIPSTTQARENMAETVDGGMIVSPKVEASH